MRAKTRAILEECIRCGIIAGHTRAYKYSDDPSDEHIRQTIDDAIWSEIDDKFEFERNLADEIYEGFCNLPESVRDCGWK